MMIEAVCMNHKGKVRCNNEDNLFFDGKVLEPDNQGLNLLLTMKKDTSAPVCVAVFDGMGGEAYGERASNLAGNLFRKRVPLDDGSEPEHFLTQLCLEANDLVCAFAKLNRVRHTGTTAAVLYAFRDRVWVCNVGDSRVYVLKEDKLVQWSVDHTDGFYLQQNGIRKKPSLTQYLGIPTEEMMIEPFVDSREAVPGEKYLLCSDGLTDMVDEKTMEALLREETDLAKCAEKLMEVALNQGGKDNITLILCRVSDK